MGCRSRFLAYQTAFTAYPKLRPKDTFADLFAEVIVGLIAGLLLVDIMDAAMSVALLPLARSSVWLPGPSQPTQQDKDAPSIADAPPRLAAIATIGLAPLATEALIREAARTSLTMAHGAIAAYKATTSLFETKDPGLCRGFSLADLAICPSIRRWL